jgi:hypothetical protein
MLNIEMLLVDVCGDAGEVCLADLLTCVRAVRAELSPALTD